MADNLGYTHLTVDYSIHFVDSVIQVTTNHVESVGKGKTEKQEGDWALWTSLNRYLMWREI